MISRFVYWVLAHKALSVWLVVLFVIGFAVVRFYATNAFVFLQVQSSLSSKGFTVQASTEGKTVKAGQLFGTTIIPRDTKNLIVSSGDYIKSQVAITIPWHGFVNQKITLTQDTNAEKTVFSSTHSAMCVSYMPAFEQLSHYTCTDPASLIAIGPSTTGVASTKKVASLDYSADPVRPYLGGVIGIAYIPSSDVAQIGDIVAYTENGTKIVYDAPVGLPKEDLTKARIFTDRNNPANKHFAIVSMDGDIYIGTPQSGRVVDYHHIPPTAEYDGLRSETYCVLTDVQTFCYRGTGIIGDTPEGFDTNKSTQSQIITHSFGEDSESTTKITTNLYSISGFYVNRDNKIFLRKDDSLYHLAKQGETYSLLRVSLGVTTASSGESLYFVHKDGGVFRVDNSNPTSSHQVFYSPNITPRSIYQASGKVFVLGSTEHSESTVFGYLLNNEPNTTPGTRLIDYFPIKEASKSGIVGSNLVGNQIYLTLLRSQRFLTPQQFDEEYARKKDSAINYLRSLDIPFDETKIRFSYY